MLGDANLCYQKWREDDFIHKSIAEPLLNVLDQCGFNVSDLGSTYSADHAQSNGNITDLQTLTLAGPIVKRPVQDPLAVLSLDNRLYSYKIACKL